VTEPSFKEVVSWVGFFKFYNPSSSFEFCLLLSRCENNEKKKRFVVNKANSLLIEKMFVAELSEKERDERGERKRNSNNHG